MLTFDELRKANVQRCEEVWHPVGEWSATDWATAVAGECGEACNQVKKLRRMDDREGVQDSRLLAEEKFSRLRKIAYELADTVIYIDLLAARLGIDLGQAIRDKFNLVSGENGSTIQL